MELQASTPEGLPYIDLRSHPVDPEVAKLLPETTARRWGMLPFARTPDAVHVAVSRSIEREGLQALAHLEQPTRLSWAPYAQLQAAIQRVWAPHGARERQGEQPQPVRPEPERLGNVLIEAGVLSASALREALQRQAETGGRLGTILVNSNRVNALALAKAVAQQYNLPLVNLLTTEDGRQRLQTLDPRLFHLMPADFWRDHRLIPLEFRGEYLTVAMVDPADEAALEQVRDAIGCSIRPVVTGDRDITASLQRIYEREFTEQSRLGLRHAQPDNSASYTLTPAQRMWGLAVGFLAVVGVAFWPFIALVGLNALAESFYLGFSLLKLGLLARRDRTGHDIHTRDKLAGIDRATLPIYTVLVPAYRETRVLPVLARALSELDYPHDRLDVKLLLEEDDREMIAAARALHLPNFIDIVAVPASEPRTKPKACNYGLQLARGDYTVIFDAEDIPEPDQLLKAVVAFRKSGPEVACVQAKLAYFNREQNLLTRWFTAEYLMWFDLFLPALHGSPVPIPLGGTSNHFRTSVLREVGAWDPFNVAEDADLGIRLHKDGYRTAIVESATYEEANSHLGNWIRQRSRWVKGYMQTWLVHMRHPLALWRAMGTSGFVGFQVLIGGTPMTLLLNPLYAVLTTLWYLTHLDMLHVPFPGWVYWVAAINLLLGNFAFTYANMAAVARRNVWDLMGWAALSPVYWALMSIAAWKALVQLILRPSYWEKTEHGLTSTPTNPTFRDQSIAS
jgi:glycosyltransferase XagB